MRSKKEVLKEITWRESEIKKINKSLDGLTTFGRAELYNRRATLTFAIEWCKWFLNA